MSRPKKKPNYNPHQIMQEFMDAIADAFGFYDDRDDDTAPGLNAVAAEFGITSLKTRKLLITAGVYSTSLSRQIAELAAGGYKIEQMMEITELSRASVHSYLPYTVSVGRFSPFRVGLKTPISVNLKSPMHHVCY